MNNIDFKIFFLWSYFCRVFNVTNIFLFFTKDTLQYFCKIYRSSGDEKNIRNDPAITMKVILRRIILFLILKRCISIDNHKGMTISTKILFSLFLV